MKAERLGSVGLAWVLAACLGCSFQPGLPDGQDQYPPCASDADCRAGCSCLGSRICVPDQPGTDCRAECTEAIDCDQETSTSQCVQGICQILACDPGRSDCDLIGANGCEVDLRSDPDHCGACTTSCLVDHADSACHLGRCDLVACAGGWGDCNGDPDDGCERELGTLTDCVACDWACSSNQFCGAGGCRCKPGFADCDNEPGCETPLGTVADCADCGDECARPHAATDCQAGQCAIVACVPPFADCNSDVDDGCEANTNWSALHCGGCINPCISLDGMACVGGSCVGSACTLPLADCDGDQEHDCEANLWEDPQNCGQCEFPCELPNAEPECQAGLCSTEICDSGWGDCDLVTTNGCEADLRNDPDHCNDCHRVCTFPHAVAQCSQGECILGPCDPDFGDCNDEVDDGCEADLNTSKANCGACENTCEAVHASDATCQDGICRLVCHTDWADCDQVGSNGCETDLSNALYNCRNCQDLCPPRSTCAQDGSCVAGEVICSGRVCRPDEVCCVSGAGSDAQCVKIDQGQYCSYALACDSNADCNSVDERCCFGLEGDGQLKCRPSNECAAWFTLCQDSQDCPANQICCDSQFPGIQTCQNGPCVSR